MHVRTHARTPLDRASDSMHARAHMSGRPGFARFARAHVYPICVCTRHIFRGTFAHAGSELFTERSSGILHNAIAWRGGAKRPVRPRYGTAIRPRRRCRRWARWKRCAGLKVDPGAKRLTLPALCRT